MGCVVDVYALGYVCRPKGGVHTTLSGLLGNYSPYCLAYDMRSLPSGRRGYGSANPFLIEAGDSRRHMSSLACCIDFLKTKPRGRERSKPGTGRRVAYSFRSARPTFALRAVPTFMPTKRRALEHEIFFTLTALGQRGV